MSTNQSLTKNILKTPQDTNSEQHIKFKSLEIVSDFGEGLLNIVDNSYQGISKDFGVITGGELFRRNITSLPMLLGDFIAKSGLMVLAGSSDAAKSMFCRNLVLALVMGDTEFLDWKFSPSRHCKAIVLSSEDDDTSISFLIRKQLSGISLPDIDKESLLNNLFFMFDSDDIFTRLHGILSRQLCDVILIDTLGDILENPSDNGEMRKRLGEFKKLAMEFNVLILLMHHTSKKTENQAPNKSSILGAAGLEQKCRLALELRIDLQDPTIRHLSVLKGNYLSKEHKNSSYVLDFDSDTFTFKNTGLRVPFEDLVTPVQLKGNVVKKNGIPPFGEIDHLVKMQLLGPIYTEYSAGLTRKPLTPLLIAAFKDWYKLDAPPGRDKILDYIELLQFQKYLTKPDEDGLKGCKALIKAGPKMFLKDGKQLDFIPQLN